MSSSSCSSSSITGAHASSGAKRLCLLRDVFERVRVESASGGSGHVGSRASAAAAAAAASVNRSLAHEAKNLLMVPPQRCAVADGDERDVQLLAVLVQETLAVLADGAA
jgi:hypothetical protein